MKTSRKNGSNKRDKSMRRWGEERAGSDFDQRQSRYPAEAETYCAVGYAAGAFRSVSGFGFVRGIEQAAGKAAGAADALLFRKYDASRNQPRASPPCHHGAEPTSAGKKMVEEGAERR